MFVTRNPWIFIAMQWACLCQNAIWAPVNNISKLHTCIGQELRWRQIEMKHSNTVCIFDGVYISKCSLLQRRLQRGLPSLNICKYNRVSWASLGITVKIVLHWQHSVGCGCFRKIYDSSRFNVGQNRARYEFVLVFRSINHLQLLIIKTLKVPGPIYRFH